MLVSFSGTFIVTVSGDDDDDDCSGGGGGGGVQAIFSVVVVVVVVVGVVIVDSKTPLCCLPTDHNFVVRLTRNVMMSRAGAA